MLAAESRVAITRAYAEYHVSRDHPAPHALKARLDDAAGRLARDALAAAFRPFSDNADASVWIIRRLEVALVVGTGWDADGAARAWAAAVAQRMGRVLDAGADGENVLRFPDWAAYLASFLGDLVEGQAWSRWCYRAFEGLRMLPVSAAIRTAVLSDREHGWAALLHLPERRLHAVLEALSAQDARRITDEMADGEEGAARYETLLPALGRALRVAVGEERFALLLALEASREAGRPLGAGLTAAARGLARLRQLTSAHGDLTAALLAAGRGDPAALYQAVGHADAGLLLPLGGCPPDLLRELVAVLAGAAGSATASEAAAPRRYTPFGGCFLLLADLDRLPLRGMLAGFPPLAGIDSAAAMRLLLLSRMGGPARADALFYDPLLRDLCGVDPRFSPADAARWLAHAPPGAWQVFRRGLDEWRGPADRSAGLGIVKADARGGPVLALVDLDSAIWLALVRYDERRSRHWCAAKPVLAAYDPATWQGNPHLVASARSALGIEAAPAPERMGRADAGSDAVSSVNKLPLIADELRFLRAPAAWGIERRADLTLALAGQRLLRRFSRDLRGFGHSGAAYLFDNFLNFAAGLEEGERVASVFFAQPRLALVLRRAGLLSASYRLSWLGDRRFELYPEA